MRTQNVNIIPLRMQTRTFTSFFCDLLPHCNLDRVPPLPLPSFASFGVLPDSLATRQQCAIPLFLYLAPINPFFPYPSLSER